MKRVIAVAGDSIKGVDGRILINGFVIEEPYAEFGGASDGPAMRSFSERIIPPGKLFVMGDNRDFSFDSRQPEHGDVDVFNVNGKVLYSFSLTGENSPLTAPK